MAMADRDSILTRTWAATIGNFCPGEDSNLSGMARGLLTTLLRHRGYIMYVYVCIYMFIYIFNYFTCLVIYLFIFMLCIKKGANGVVLSPFLLFYRHFPSS